LRNSLVKESSPNKSGEYMIYDLVSDIEKLSECLLDSHGIAAKMGDIGTIYLLGKIIKDLGAYH
jgi:DNA-binding ferritin-like protein